MEDVTFGQWVQRRRRSLLLTQAELAEQALCSTAAIRKIEADERRPSAAIAEYLAQVLAIPNTQRAAFVRFARGERSRRPLDEPLAQPIELPVDRGGATPGGAALKAYTLGPVSGAGRWGVVYRAFQASVHRDVAIKIIRPDLADHPAVIRHFDREMQRVARLEHPFIVPLYDSWREPGGAYVVMRYLRGGTLQQILESGPLDLDRWCTLLEQLAGALSFAHRHGVVHRDLTPANILLDGEGRAFVSDFGLAGLLTSVDDTPATHPTAPVPTRAYAAPEQLTNGTITSRTDVYSFGVLLYAALTGRNPFEHLPLAGRATSVLPPIISTEHDLPPGLETILRRASAPEPNVRYAVVDHLAADLLAAVRGRALPAASMSLEPTTHGAGRVRDTVASTNPYKGLRAFAEQDAADFFGRETLTERLLVRMAEETALARFLAVVGPSGSGKSSAIRAGLIPALRRGAVPGSDAWFVVDVIPGAQPWDELAAALTRVAVAPLPDDLEPLYTAEDGLLRAVQWALPPDPAVELVLVIDQFEEVFTLLDDEAARRSLLTQLLTAVTDPHSRLRVIVTLRADFFDRPLRYSPFGDLLRQRTEIIVPLTPAELERAIVGPAPRAGLEIEPGVVAALVAEVAAQPGSLPLLQYALTELVQRHHNRKVTLTVYQQSGGVAHALVRRAEEVYTTLSTREHAVARQLFLRLITLGEGVEDTRRRVRRSEIMAALGDSGVVEVVMSAFGAYRLLTFDHEAATREPTIEVAHEALLQRWERLRAWLDGYRDAVRNLRHLIRSTDEWITAGRDASFVSSGARLVQLEGLLSSDLVLTAQERAYLAASIDARAAQAAAQEQARQRELAHTRALADEQARRAESERQRAEEYARVSDELRVANRNAERARLAAQAANVLDTSADGSLPALLALQSLKLGTSPQAYGVLLRALSKDFIRQQFLGHTGTIYGTTFLPGGASIVTASGDTTARIWNVATGEEMRRLAHPTYVWDVDVSPDGASAVTACGDGAAWLWDVATGQEVRQLVGHTAALYSVAWSPDGQVIGTASADTTARIWDVATGYERFQLVGHTKAVTGIAFSPDGRELITVSGDLTARIWTAATGHHVRTLAWHHDGRAPVLPVPDGGLFRACFSPDGTQVVTGGPDTSARLWDAATGELRHTLVGHTGTVTGVAFVPESHLVATASTDRTVRLWNTATGQEVRRFTGPEELYSVALSPDGQRILSSETLSSAWLWDMQRAQEPLVLAGHRQAISNLALSPDGSSIATVSNDGTVRLWERSSGHLIRTFQDHINVNPAGLAFSPDGRTIVSAAPLEQGILRLWRTDTGECVRTMGDRHAIPAAVVRFSPDGRVVISGGWDGTVRIWDVHTWQEVRTLQGHTDGVLDLAVSRDGRWVMSASLDRSMRQWELATGQEIRRLVSDTGGVGGVAYTPDETQIITGGEDKTVRLWNLATGEEVRQFVGHSGVVRGVALSPDGRWIVSVSDDHTARLWDITTGREVLQFAGHAGAVYKAIFSPDGQHVLTGSTDTTVRVWSTDMHATIQKACALLPRDLTAEERITYGLRDTGPTCSDWEASLK